jgi:hypothetical protein
MAELTTKDVVIALQGEIKELTKSHYELKGAIAPTSALVADHEARLRKLERRFASIPRGTSIVAAVGAFGAVIYPVLYIIFR